MKFQQPYRKTTSESRRCTQKSRVSFGPCQTYLSDLLSVLIHLSPTPRLFSILCGGQRGSTGPQGDKNQSDGELASSAPWRASNRADISKWNKTPLDSTRHYLSPQERFLHSCPGPPDHCLQPAEPNSCCPEEATEQLVLAGCSPLASTHSTRGASLPGSFSSFISACSPGCQPSKAQPSPPFFTLGRVYHKTGTKLTGIALRNKGNFRSFAGNIIRHWEKRFLRNCWPLSGSINPPLWTSCYLNLELFS